MEQHPRAIKALEDYNRFVMENQLVPMSLFPEWFRLSALMSEWHISKYESIPSLYAQEVVAELIASLEGFRL